MLQLRDYQQECKDIIENLKGGSHLIRMATGLGKTVTFTSLKRQGRVLVLAHREELVNQPVSYYDCEVGVEQADRSSNGEEVVVASVQSLVRRLGKFKPHDFDTIITDECHHSPAPSYRSIYDHFQPRLHLGFTATPNRGDGVRLDDIYEDIIFDKDLRWGIRNGYLAGIECLRADIGFDLSKVRRRMGDYAQNDLEAAMDITRLNQAIAEAYEKYAKRQTLIFATSVKHAYNIAKEIKGAVVVTADTPDRDAILHKFKAGKIKVLINVMVFTEGTDLPNIETIIIARPTQNTSLYTQMVGRGLRLYEGKDKLTLIDCVGISGKHDLCTAPSLLGVDMQLVPQDRKNRIVGDLFSLESNILKESDVPQSWIKNMEIVDLWSKDQSYDTKGINWFRLPNGDFVCHLPGSEPILIKAPDELGKTTFNGLVMDMQQAFDRAYQLLKTEYAEAEQIWNLSKARVWGSQPATAKQIEHVKRHCPGFKTTNLSRLEASQILNRVFSQSPAEKAERTKKMASENKEPAANVSKASFRMVSTVDMLQNPPPDEYVVVYLYTTGPNPYRDKIASITAMKFKSGKQVGVLDVVIDPKESPSNTSSNPNKKRGMTQKVALPTTKEAIIQLQSFIGRLPIVAHQVSFALQFMKANGFTEKGNFTLDTLALAKAKYPQLKDYSLPALEGMAFPAVSAANARLRKLAQASALLRNANHNN